MIPFIRRQKRLVRILALVLIVQLLAQTFFPVASYALTSGPDTPEFSDFEPVATTDMVNLFSGDFNYNLPVLEIPGPDGAGYALSLSYHSGNSSEEEASWVGYGFSLNPGSISRQMRGFPDDYKDVSVTQYNKTRPNWSASVTGSIGMEISSADAAKPTQSAKEGALKIGNWTAKKLKPIKLPGPGGTGGINGGSSGAPSDGDPGGGDPGGGDNGSGSKLKINGGINASTTLRFNNYQGYQRTNGYGISAMGLGSVKMNVGAQGPTFSAEINYAAIYHKLTKTKSKEDNAIKEKKNEKKWKTNARRAFTQLARSSARSMLTQLGSTHGIFSFSEAARGTGITKINSNESIANNYRMGFSVKPTVAIGFQTGYYMNFNRQVNEEASTMQAYGYMYTPSGMGENVLSDYHLERNSTFQKRDLFLAIPFNDADQFVVSGEGLGGGFRFRPNQIGNFYPNKLTNKYKIISTGFDLGLGPGTVSIGANLGIGWNKSIVQNWARTGNSGAIAYQERVGSFAFSQDMGGMVAYGDVANKAAVLDGSGALGTVSPNILPHRLDTDAFAPSSYVAYRTYGDIKKADKPTSEDARIAEMRVWNADGIQYVYGKPMHARNETNLSFGVSTPPPDRYLARRGDKLPIKQQTGGSFYVETGGEQTVMGSLNPSPYATQFLLTEILSPDYVDVNDNGISDAVDFGAWTQFRYREVYGTGATDWFRWRTPYDGLLYRANSISDTKDDMGTVMTGEKQISYLGVIETKTHVAFFVTNKTTDADFLFDKIGIDATQVKQYLKGTGNDRLDAMGATAEQGGQPQKLQYLEKIVLFAKARPEKPLKTIRFDYDYSLVGNLPNHTRTSYPASRTSAQSGKLTLRKVWFEYEGAVRAKISPYEFSYAYKKSSEMNIYRDDYKKMFVETDKLTETAQNPDYTPQLLDPWQCVQRYARERYKYLIPWVYQGAKVSSGEKSAAINPASNWRAGVTVPTTTSEQIEDFDPAAWQLKQIKLPSGGEILIQYEQKDYAYVQDRPPMAMASLLAEDETKHTFVGGEQYKLNPNYTINVRDLGIDPSLENKTDAQKEAVKNEVERQVAVMNDFFVRKPSTPTKTEVRKDRIYFKFLYTLFRRGPQEPGLDNCNSDYITGYATVKEVKPVLINNEWHIQITITGEEAAEGYEAVPRQACYDFYSTQRMGKWDGNNCTASLEEIYKDGPPKGVKEISEMGSILTENLFNQEYRIPDKIDVGTNMSLPLSFLRVPMLKAKKGGGIRVKRLLMYDPGIEAGDAGLYGQEYLYEDFRKVRIKEGDKEVDVLEPISSGVATNEPSGAREENPLVGFLPRQSQRWYSRITAGEDQEQTEGPLGESILPAPSIGHSRVVVHNIHTGTTGTGFTVTEYFTAKDYPYDRSYVEKPGQRLDFGKQARGVEYTSLSANEKKQMLVIPAGLFSFSLNKVWHSQAYRFIQNSMHGQMKRTASYAGDYPDFVASSIASTQARLRQLTKISEQIYEYYEPGEMVKVLQSDGSYKEIVPGKEMDVAMEMKNVKEQNIDLSFEIDVDIDVKVLTILPTFGLNFELSDLALNTHVISKILQYPAIVKKVTSYHDGATSVTENLAFSSETGQPILTRTADSFDGVTIDGNPHDGSLYTLALPASWYYTGMGKKSKDNTHTNQVSTMVGQVVARGADNELFVTKNGVPGLQIPQKNVLAASAQTFAKGWFFQTQLQGAEYAKLLADYALDPDKQQSVMAKLNAIWRPKASYVYRDDAVSSNLEANGLPGRIYRGGTFASFEPFPFGDESKLVSDREKYKKWILGSQIELYSPHGNALQERNVLGIQSTALFGYGNQLPVMIGTNAAYGSLAFADFEYTSHTTRTDLHAHSGFYSERIATGGVPQVVMKGLLKNNAMQQKGGQLKFWAKGTQTPVVGVGTKEFTPQRVAQTGVWTLYSLILAYSDMPATSFDLALKNTSNETLYVDDVRFQPAEADATCYVYDLKTFRLLAQFDDEHFGMYYQYNDEGKLVRKMVETERGMKTIQETQYNMPKNSARPDLSKAK